MRGTVIHGRTLPLRAEDLHVLLPHRGPFALLDRVDEIDPGRRATGHKTFSRNDPALEGHFPGRPIVPGVLLIELLGQLSGMVIWSMPRRAAEPHDDEGVSHGDGMIGVLAGVKNFRFHQLVIPGDVVGLETTLTARLAGLTEFRVTATVDRVAVADGSVQIAFRS